MKPNEWNCLQRRRKIKRKGKASPYSTAKRRVPELIPVLGSQPAGDVSHKPGHYFPPGLQLPPQPLRGLLYQFCCLVNRCTMDVNSLPKTVTRQRRGCDLNPGPSMPESSTLTTRLPSHPSMQNTHTHTHPFNGPFSGTTRVSRYQKGKTNLDFTEARDSEWQWHQLGHMHVCISLQTDNHASTPPLSFFTGRMSFLQPNQQRQSTEGIQCKIRWRKTNTIQSNSSIHHYECVALCKDIKLVLLFW